MKTFPMSCYVSQVDLYKAKAEYYEKLFRLTAGLLVTTENLSYNKDTDNYYYPHSGDCIDVGFENWVIVNNSSGVEIDKE